MLIIGAKGFAKEVLEVFQQKKQLDSLFFYDDVNEDIDSMLYGTFPVIKSVEEAQKLFSTIDDQFTIGIGNPFLRYKLYKKFEAIGGKFTSVISPFAHIGNFGTVVNEGSNIMTNAILTNDVHVGKGSLINLSCTVGHDVFMDDFVELCPDVNVSGNCKIGKFTFVGTNSTILPNIEIGTNVIVAAGSVVTKNIPDNCMVAGIPAVVKKELTPLEF